MLVADLRDLVVDLAAHGYTSTTLRMLDHTLRRYVPSTLGVTVDVRTDRGCSSAVRITLTRRTVDPYEVAASLAVPLDRLSPCLDGAATFHASEWGAFDRVAGELAAALDIDTDDLDLRPGPPTAPLVPGVSGLTDFALVNRALGVLLNRGWALEDARAELRRRAEAAGVDLTAAARTVLASAHY